MIYRGLQPTPLPTACLREFQKFTYSFVRVNFPYHPPASSIGTASAAWCVLTPAGRVTETNKTTTGYVKSPRNILHCMHSSCMVIIIANVARFTLNFFLTCIACHVETLFTARLVGMKISLTRLNHCATFCTLSFVSITLHSTIFLSVRLKKNYRSLQIRSLHLCNRLMPDPDQYQSPHL